MDDVLDLRLVDLRRPFSVRIKGPRSKSTIDSVDRAVSWLHKTLPGYIVQLKPLGSLTSYRIDVTPPNAAAPLFAELITNVLNGKRFDD